MKIEKGDKVLVINHPLHPDLIGETGTIKRVCSFCYLVTFTKHPGWMYEFYDNEIRKVNNGSESASE